MWVNGKEYVPSGEPPSSLLSLLVDTFHLKPSGVAVEMNGVIPAREEWDRIQLKADDRIEIIRFVGGG